MPLLIGSDKKILRFYSHNYNNGLKLMEHSWVGNNFVNAVLSHIKDNPMRVAWVGDYSDSVDITTFGNGFITGKRSFLHYYCKAWSDKSKAPLVDGAELFQLRINHAAFFLVNNTKNSAISSKSPATSVSAWRKPGSFRSLRAILLASPWPAMFSAR